MRYQVGGEIIANKQFSSSRLLDVDLSYGRIYNVLETQMTKEHGPLIYVTDDRGFNWWYTTGWFEPAAGHQRLFAFCE